MTISRAISGPFRRLGWQVLKRPIAGVVLTLGLLASGFPGLYLKHSSAIALPRQMAHQQVAQQPDGPAATAVTQLPGNGVYLYGESPQANQVGHTYAVFEVTDSETVGAFYMPSSSFDCFYGEVEANAMDLVVVNSYDQAAHSYSMPLGYTDIAGPSGEAIAVPVGFHRISELSPQDHQMLTTCRNDAQQRNAAI